MKKRLKINGVIIFLAVVLVVFFPRLFFRTDRIAFLDEFAEIVGVALILLGQLFRVSARGYKAEHSHNGRALIQDGPYALVRNPMYLGILLIGLGIVFMLFNWGAMAIFLIVFITRYLLLIFKEEKKLLNVFPQEYVAYSRKVPRIIPSLGSMSGVDIAEHLPLRLSWLEKEVGSILAVLVMALLLESWNDIRSQGFAEYLHETALFLTMIILFLLLTFFLSRRTEEKMRDASYKSKNNS